MIINWRKISFEKESLKTLWNVYIKTNRSPCYIYVTVLISLSFYVFERSVTFTLLKINQSLLATARSNTLHSITINWTNIIFADHVFMEAKSLENATEYTKSDMDCYCSDSSGLCWVLCDALMKLKFTFVTFGQPLWLIQLFQTKKIFIILQEFTLEYWHWKNDYA